MKVPTEKMVV